MRRGFSPDSRGCEAARCVPKLLSIHASLQERAETRTSACTRGRDRGPVGRLLDGGLSVYASGCTHLLAFNHVNNFLPYGFFLRGMREYLRGRFDVEVFVPERAGTPDVILWSRKRPGPLTDWLLAHYRVIHVPEFTLERITVWLRRDLTWPLQSRYPSAFNRDSTAGGTVECEIGGAGPERASRSRS